MGSLLVALVVGVVVGLARGGRFRHLGARRIHGRWLLAVAFVLQLVPAVFDVPAAVVWLVGSYLALGAFATLNLHLVGTGVVLVGLLLNLVVIAANGAMPVRAGAVVAAGVAERDALDRLDLGGKRRLEEPGDRLAVLGDIVPVPGLREVLSFGDLILFVALGDVVAHLLREPRQPRRRTPGRRPAAVRRRPATAIAPHEPVLVTTPGRLLDPAAAAVELRPGMALADLQDDLAVDRELDDDHGAADDGRPATATGPAGPSHVRVLAGSGAGGTGPRTPVDGGR